MVERLVDEDVGARRRPDPASYSVRFGTAVDWITPLATPTPRCWHLCVSKLVVLTLPQNPWMLRTRTTSLTDSGSAPSEQGHEDAIDDRRDVAVVDQPIADE